MARLKLTDITWHGKKRVQDGTCELCLGAPYDIPLRIFHFRTEGGREFGVEAEYISYSTSIIPDIENAAHFGEWVARQDFDDDTIEDLGDIQYSFHALRDIVEDYQVSLDETSYLI